VTGTASPAAGTRAHAVAAFVRGHRRALAACVAALALAGFAYYVLPQINGLEATLRRLRDADPWWIGLAAGLEALSLGGYILLFRTVLSCHSRQIGWRESYQITMAGVVASKLLAAAGAGGVALTVWALRASGLDPRAIARRMLTFELLLYSVFATALLVLGVGLRTGLFAGRAPWTLTIVPAAGAGLAIALVAALRALPANLEGRIAAVAGASRRGRRLLARLAAAPGALRDASATAIHLIARRESGVLGAAAYWALDIATLWACMHAFGVPPPVPVVVMAYFIGQLANTLPLPGGVGGVEGGMIGAFLAFGAHGSLAILGVLSYRVVSFWLPTLPGALAYLRLRATVARWRAA
jgi:putative heme transporter